MKDENLKDAIDDIKERMKVDQFSLEEECKKQPLFYKDVGMIHVQARTIMKKARSFLKAKYAEIALEARRDPGKFGLTKVTDASLDSAVITQKEYKELEEEMFQAEEDAEFLGVLLESAAQRKSMIRDLVTLYCRQYYEKEDMHVEESKLSGVTESKITDLRRRRAEQRKKDEE